MMELLLMEVVFVLTGMLVCKIRGGTVHLEVEVVLEETEEIEEIEEEEVAHIPEDHHLPVMGMVENTFVVQTLGHLVEDQDQEVPEIEECSLFAIITEL